MKYSFLKKLAGNYKKNPDMVDLGWKAEELIERAFIDIPEGKFIDCHTHIMGLGANGTGCWMNPDILSWKQPIDHFKTMIYINCSGIENMENADQEYLNRFIRLVDDFPYGGRFMLLALDKVYNKDGSENLKDTKFYVPNEYIYKLYQADPERFIPCISVHPYRKDATDELEKWAKRGVRAVKWLPNSMGMDPSDDLCEPFYEKMREHDMVLLGHAGEESAIEVIKFKQYGNPLLFRKPLEMGVKVIMAHCASLGTGIDIESSFKKPTKYYKLFLRLMEEKKYEGLLFADISAMTQINRMGMPLRTMLKRKDLHHRLINGSDYPLPAANAVISTNLFTALGFITKKEREGLNQIYKRNPLLFDFVLKRCLKDPLNHDYKFSAGIFQENTSLKLSPVLNRDMVTENLK